MKNNYNNIYNSKYYCIFISIQEGVKLSAYTHQLQKVKVNLIYMKYFISFGYNGSNERFQLHLETAMKKNENKK